MVNCKLVEPLSGMLAAPKALMITGGAATVMDVLDVLPAPPSMEVTWTLLFLTPRLRAVTFSEKVQLVLAASVPPERLMLPDPAVAVAVPPQVLLKPLGVATARPDGKLSVNATPVRPPLLGLLMVKVRVVD